MRAWWSSRILLGGIFGDEDYRLNSPNVTKLFSESVFQQ